jgi:cytochrome c oxidase cbb3-type subunit 1
MLVVPLVILAMNFFGTLSGRWSALKDNITLRFVAFGVVALLLVLLGWVINAIHGIAAITQFTYVTAAETQLGLYGFFTMVVFGALYYIVPRVLNTAWASAPLAGVHFGASATGIALVVGALVIGGVKQGLLLGDATVAFSEITAATQPYLFAATIGLAILAIGQLAFALNFFWTLGRASADCVRSAKTLLSVQPEAAR